MSLNGNKCTEEDYDCVKKFKSEMNLKMMREGQNAKIKELNEIKGLRLIEF